MHPEEPETIAEAVDEVLILRLTPELADRYQQLKEQLRRLMDEEKRDFTGPLRYLKRRRAPKQEMQELRARREEEFRRLKEEFHARVNALIRDGTTAPDLGLQKGL